MVLSSRRAHHRLVLILLLYPLSLVVRVVTKSPNHLVRPRQHVGRNGQADLLGRFEIDDELELHWLLDRKIGWLGTLQDFIHISGNAAVLVDDTRSVSHEAACVHIIAIWINRWQPALCRKIRDPGSVAGKHGGRQHYERSGAPSGYRGKGAFEIVGIFHRRRLEWEPQ